MEDTGDLAVGGGLTFLTVWLAILGGIVALAFRSWGPWALVIGVPWSLAVGALLVGMLASGRWVRGVLTAIFFLAVFSDAFR